MSMIPSPSPSHTPREESKSHPILAPSPRSRPRYLHILKSFAPTFWLLTLCCLVVYGTILPFNNIASSLLQERNYFKPNPPSCQLTNPDACQSSVNPPLPTCPSSSRYQPPLPTTLDASKIDCSSPSSTSPGACPEAFCSRQKAAIKEADRVMSIPYTISAILSPILGLLIDRFGCRAIVITAAPLLLLLVHLSLAYWLSFTPYVPLIGQGVAYSAFAAVLWPSVPFTVPSDKVGLAYGLTTAIQNTGLALFPLLAAAIYKQAHSSYLPHVELLFVALAIMGILCGIVLNVLDVKAGNVLNRADWQPSRRLASNGGSRQEPLLDVEKEETI